MPHVDAHSLLLPFTGRSPRSRRTSLQGACVAVVRAGSQASRMLSWYLARGPLTDLEMAKLMGLPESRISARRSGLMTRRLVAWVEDVPGPHGAENCVWNLTPEGRAIAEAMEADETENIVFDPS